MMANDMMDDDLDSAESPVSIIKRIAEAEVEKVRTMEWATVKAIYPHKSEDDNQIYQCDVELKNGGNELRNVNILTPHIGCAWIPNIGDQVLIGYVGGSVNSPVVLGTVYDGNHEPPVSGANRMIQTLPQDILFKQKSSTKRDWVGFEWDVNGVIMAMRKVDVASYYMIEDVQNQKFYAAYDTKGNVVHRCTGVLQLGVASDIDNVRQPQGNEAIIIVADRDVTIESNGKVTVKAPQVEIVGDVTISGGNIKLKGSSISIESSGSLDLKGSTVNIN